MVYYELVMSDESRLVGCDGIMDERGLSYGDGFFSTMGVHVGRIICEIGHRTRLDVSAKRFELVFDIDGVMETLAHLATQIQNGILKIIITRDTQAVRGYGYIDGRVRIFVKAMPSPVYENVSFIDDIPYQAHAKAVCLDEMVSLRTPRFYGLKLISSHESVFIHRELLDHQKADSTIAEGLVKSTLGDWLCGVMSNVFYHLDGHWYTPPTIQAGVAGVMRERVMNKFNIDTRTFNDDDLACIDGLFFCNAVRGIMPIRTLITDTHTMNLAQTIVPM